MALRLIEMVLSEDEGITVRKLLKNHTIVEQRQVRLPENKVMVRILLEAEKSESAGPFHNFLPRNSFQR